MEDVCGHQQAPGDAGCACMGPTLNGSPGPRASRPVSISTTPPRLRPSNLPTNTPTSLAMLPGNLLSVRRSPSATTATSSAGNRRRRHGWPTTPLAAMPHTSWQRTSWQTFASSSPGNEAAMMPALAGRPLSDARRGGAVAASGPWDRSPRGTGPAMAVPQMVALQAQDFWSGVTSVVVRSTNGTSSSVHSALDNGFLIRTWAPRGTLHLLAASDVRWMLDLLARRLWPGGRPGEGPRDYGDRARSGGAPRSRAHERAGTSQARRARPGLAPGRARHK